MEPQVQFTREECATVVTVTDLQPPILLTDQETALIAGGALVGNFLSGLAPQLGQSIGGHFGNTGLSQQIGGVAGQLGQLLPF